MTPAEFYVSSDALVHLQVSTEYLSKSCRTIGLPSKKKLAVEVKVQQGATPARRVKYLMRRLRPAKGGVRAERDSDLTDLTLVRPET